MKKPEIQTLKLSLNDNFVEVFFVIHKRNAKELEGKYPSITKDSFLHYWEIEILCHENLLEEIHTFKIKEGNVGKFLSYCNAPAKDDLAAINIIKKLMLCSYYAKVKDKESLLDLLKYSNTDCICKEIEKNFKLNFSN